MIYYHRVWRKEKTVQIEELIKMLNDMLLLYGDKIILRVMDSENEYRIKSVSGNPCAKYFQPSDKVAEVIIKIGSR